MHTICAVHVDLAEHGPLEALALREGLDLRGGGWLLATELVAGEGEDLEPGAGVLILQRG